MVKRVGAVVLLGVLAPALVAGCGGAGVPASTAAAAHTQTLTPVTTTTTTARRSTSSAASTTTRTSGAARPRPKPRHAPPLVVTAPLAAGARWAVVALVRGHPAAWLAARSGVTLLRFDQRYVHLVLHTGAADGGTTGWRYGDEITPSEIHHLVAGFNGGFRLSYRDVGFVSGGRVAVPLSRGLASIVTYADGVSAIGGWDDGVPARHRRVFSVLQNQYLLVDRGVAAANVSSCVQACWGATIGGVTVIARSGLGIRRDGQLVWAAGEQLSPAGLAAALVGAGAIRAVELDINPDWVDGYLYTHHSSGPRAAPIVPGQLGIAGELLAPDSRDFLAVVAD